MMVEERVVETRKPSRDLDDVDHVGCHCGEGTPWIVWCGIKDSSELVEGFIQDSTNPCPFCMIVAEQCWEKGKCPWGCDCSQCGSDK